MSDKTQKIEVFSKLTSFLDKLDGDEYGVFDYPDGHMPFCTYTDNVCEFAQSVCDFDKEHPEYNLKNYLKTIKEAGLKNIEKVNPKNLDPYLTMAILIYIVRQERFCDGLLLACLKNGLVQKLLLRLKDFDKGAEVHL